MNKSEINTKIIKGDTVLTIKGMKGKVLEIINDQYKLDFGQGWIGYYSLDNIIKTE